MSLQDFNLKLNTKQNIDAIIEFIGEDELQIAELIDVFVNGGTRVSQTTSWALGHISEKNPQLIAPYHSTLLIELTKKNKINAVRRNIVRIYQTCEIPESIEGELYDLCLKFVLDPKEAIAVKAFSMRVCERIATKYPDLIPELIVSIETVFPNGSSGLKNRAYQTLQRLKNIL